MDEECLLSIEMEKLDAIYALRIPSSMKNKLENELTPAQRKQLNEKIMMVMDHGLYDAKYVPGQYLKKRD